MGSSTVVIAIAGVLAVAAIGFVIGIYNGLVQVRNNVDKAWKNIDVLLQQRHDELSKLVEACKGYIRHEREVLDALTKLRVGYDEARSAEEKIEVENRLNREVARLRHTWEGYPDLKANQNFLKLQERISGVESSIADRREFLNESVNIYNIQIERFPEVLMARLFSYRRKAFLEVPAQAMKDVNVAVA